jgi:hypothetical protein
LTGLHIRVAPRLESLVDYAPIAWGWTTLRDRMTRERKQVWRVDRRAMRTRRAHEMTMVYRGMATIVCAFDRLSNQDLLLEIKRLARSEREATATLIASLMELDARQLYLAEGCSSLFTYCTEVLHLSEHAAYGRIKAARAAQAFPLILDLLVEGAITLTTVTVLAPHLTRENHAAVLAEAQHKSKRQLEELAARLTPRPAIPAAIRKLPEPKTRTVPPNADADIGTQELALSTSAAPAMLPGPKPAEVTPLAPERYKVQLTFPKRPTTNCAACRTCCGIRSRTRIQP